MLLRATVLLMLLSLLTVVIPQPLTAEPSGTTGEVSLADGSSVGSDEAAVQKTWPPIRWHEMSVGERTAGVVFAKTGTAEILDPGRPRSTVDPLRPPDGSSTGVFNSKQIDYFVPYYMAHPGAEALAFYEKLTRDHPENPEYHGRLAMCNMQMGHLAVALDEGSKAVALKPDGPWGHLAIALTQQNLFELEQAAASFRKLLEIAPDGFGDSFFTREFLLQCLADVELRRGNRDDAEKLLLDAFASEKGNCFAQKMMERFYLRSRQPEKALALYQKILETTPDDFNAHLNLGCLLNFLGKPDEAIVELEKARALQPDLIHPHFALHRSYYAQGNLEKALEHLKSCQGMDMEAQNNLAIPNNIVTSFPEPTMLFQQMAMALGDWKRLQEIEEYLANFNPPVIIENEVSDDIPDHQGYPEWCDEDSMRFFYETNGRQAIQNRFLERLVAVLQPTTPSGGEQAARGAEALVAGKAEEALAAAEAGLKLEPDCLLFMLQQGMALRLLQRFPELWKLDETLAGIIAKEKKDSVKEFAILFARVLYRSDMVVKAVKSPAGKTLYMGAMLTEKFSDAELKKLHDFYQASIQRAGQIRAMSLSVMQRALASLLMSRMVIDTRQPREASVHFADYVRYDREYLAVQWIFSNFGLYYGF